VNEESISDYELRQRMALFIALYSLKPTAEDLKRIRSQVLEKMENEKTQLQEAVRKHITVSPDEVDKVLNTLLAQNHITIEQLRSTLGAAGASELALRSEITAQIAWQKTVQEQHSDPANRGLAQVAAATPASAGSGSGNAPRPKTESALRCLLGMERDGCESIFAKAQQIAARRQIRYCAMEYTHQITGCPRNLGPLESVTYLGTGQDLADVYDVDYLGEHTTYCILPPAPDGKMSGFLIFGISHSGIVGPCAVISSPADPPQILYTRPQDHAALH
jgi:hypothetical protein